MLKQIALAGLFSAAVAGCSGVGGKHDDGAATRVPLPSARSTSGGTRFPLQTVGAGAPKVHKAGGIYRAGEVINAGRNTLIVGDLGEVCRDVVAKSSGNAKGATRDTMSGHGALTLHNGDVYEGQFKDCLPSGCGTLVKPDGRRFAGVWEEGCLLTHRAWVMTTREACGF